MKCERLVVSRVVVLLLLLSACSPSDAQIATAIAQTEMARPTSTFTPEPTATLTQTPTPTQTSTPTLEPTPTLALSDVVKETYSDIEVTYQNDFENIIPGDTPAGWQSDGELVHITSENSLEINGRNIVAYLESETIRVNEAVIVRFMFAPGSHFTIGIDGLRQGERIPAYQPGLMFSKSSL